MRWQEFQAHPDGRNCLIDSSRRSFRVLTVKAIRRFTVRTVLPDELGALEELARNLRWFWHLPTRQVFEDISPAMWASTEHDPIALLGEIGPERLRELAADGEFVARANALLDDLHTN